MKRRIGSALMAQTGSSGVPISKQRETSQSTSRRHIPIHGCMWHTCSFHPKSLRRSQAYSNDTKKPLHDRHTPTPFPPCLRPLEEENSQALTMQEAFPPTLSNLAAPNAEVWWGGRLLLLDGPPAAILHVSAPRLGPSAPLRVVPRKNMTLAVTPGFRVPSVQTGISTLVLMMQTD